MQHALWKSLVLPASGVALSWLLLMTLGLPLVDYARSYRPWVYLVAQHVPNGVCVAAQLPRSALAALENYSNWRIDAKGDVAKTTECEYLLVDENRHATSSRPRRAGRSWRTCIGRPSATSRPRCSGRRPRRPRVRPTSAASRSRAEAHPHAGPRTGVTPARGGARHQRPRPCSSRFISRSMYR